MCVKKRAHRRSEPWQVNQCHRRLSCDAAVAQRSQHLDELIVEALQAAQSVGDEHRLLERLRVQLQERRERERAERERERPIKKGGGTADEFGGASVLHADACAQRVAVWPLTEKGPPDDALPGAIDGVAMRCGRPRRRASEHVR